MISTKQRSTAEEAAETTQELGFEATDELVDEAQFRIEVDAEPERGRRGSATNVAGVDTIVADDLALRERPDRYTRLALMEMEWSLARLSAGWSTTRT